MLTHAQTVTHRSLAFARAPTFTLSLMHTMRTRKEEERGRRRRKRRRTGFQACAHCRLLLAWESLMRSSLRAEVHAAISKALCCSRFITGSVAECWSE